jgi:hypothetical protein
MKKKKKKSVNNPYNNTPIMPYFRQLRGCKSTLNGGRLKRQSNKNDRLTAVNLLRLFNLPNFSRAGGV